MQYLISWLLCLTTTALSVLIGLHDWQQLVVSDLNATLFLVLAYCFEKWRDDQVPIHMHVYCVRRGQNCLARQDDAPNNAG